MNYRDKAAACVQHTVLPVQRQQFQECGNSLDEQYKRYGNTEGFFGRVLEPGHLYEIGYPKCVCPETAAGTAKSPDHCECPRQSVLYILEQLLPGKTTTVTTMETVLRGGECCRFRVTVE